MILTIEEQNLLKYYGNLIVDRLRFDILNKRVTKFGAVSASGDLAKSVRFEVDERGLRVYANDYIYYLEHGRKPGKFPPLDLIRKWIQDKRLDFDIDMDSLAFLIGRKIAKEGTTAWEQGGTDLVAGVITDDLLDRIREDFASLYLKEIKSDILKAYGIAA